MAAIPHDTHMRKAIALSLKVWEIRCPRHAHAAVPDLGLPAGTAVLAAPHSVAPPHTPRTLRPTITTAATSPPPHPSGQAGVTERTGGCFGAVIVDAASGEVVAEGFNQVLSKNDPTRCVRVRVWRGGGGAQ